MKSPQFDVHAKLEQTHWWFTARRRIVRALIERLVPASTDALIVEIGCGTGGNVAELSLAYSCLGIDTDPSAIGSARRRFPDLKFVCGKVPQDVDRELRMARVILLLDVLEHVQDDFLLLSQVLAAVTPGTYVLLTVPADLELWTEHDVSFGHFRRYDRSRLQASWEGLAVSCLLCSYFNSRLYLPIKWVRRFNRRSGQTWGESGTDFVHPAAIVNWLLHRVFAGEARVLASALAAGQPAGYRRGVSLMAILRCEAGKIVPRTKPAKLEGDDFNPDERQDFVTDGTRIKHGFSMCCPYACCSSF